MTTIPAWFHGLSIVWLSLGGLCSLVVIWDVIRHPQHMWIMNIVWPVGTVWILWQYFKYGRFAEQAS